MRHHYFNWNLSTEEADEWACQVVNRNPSQEERDFLRTGLVSMTRRAPGLFSGGTRSLMGLYVGQRTDLEPAAVRYRDRAA